MKKDIIELLFGLCLVYKLHLKTQIQSVVATVHYIITDAENPGTGITNQLVINVEIYKNVCLAYLKFKSIK